MSIDNKSKDGVVLEASADILNTGGKDVTISLEHVPSESSAKYDHVTLSIDVSHMLAGFNLEFEDDESRRGAAECPTGDDVRHLKIQMQGAEEFSAVLRCIQEIARKAEEAGLIERKGESNRAKGGR